MSYLSALLIVFLSCHLTSNVAQEAPLEPVQTGAFVFQKLFQNYAQRPCDLLFVLDRSTGLHAKQWNLMISFVVSTVQNFVVDMNHTRVAIVTFGTSASIDINDLDLNLASVYGNKCTLVSRIHHLLDYKSLGGYHFTHSALQSAKNLLLSSRSYSKKIIIVISVGKSNIGPAPVRSAAEIHSLRWDSSRNETDEGRQLELFSLGIQETNLKELHSIASPLENHTIYFQDWHLFEALVNSLQQEPNQNMTLIKAFDDDLCDQECSEHAQCMCNTQTGDFLCACNPGYQNLGNICEACPVGFYKDSVSTKLCSPCPRNSLTSTAGATDINQCFCLFPYSRHYITGECVLLNCTVLPSIPYGRQICMNNHMTSNPEMIAAPCDHAGCICQYECEDGYELIGQQRLLCKQEGLWSGPPPFCQDCGALTYVDEKPSNVQIYYMDNKTTFGGVVTVLCDHGWKLYGDASRTCTKYGTWSGTPAYCLETKCLPLPTIPHGSIFPPSCADDLQTVGQECHVQCNHGFSVHGPSTLICNTSGIWFPTSMYKCVDTEPPEMTCPDDKTIIIKHSSYTTFSWQEYMPQVKDNDGILQVNGHNLFNNSLKLSVGSHELWFQAEDFTGNIANCSNHVIVLEQKITMVACPENMQISDVIEDEMAVTWSVHPVFRDKLNNTVNFTCTHQNGTLFPLGLHDVTCVPEEEMEPVCKFSVNLTKPVCSMPCPPHHGNVTCESSSHYLKVCQARCENNFDFVTNSEESYRCDEKGQWHLGRWGKFWSDCSPRYFPYKITLKTQYIFHLFANCDDEVRGQIEFLFWTKMQQTIDKFCQQNFCRLEDVNIFCEPNSTYLRTKSKRSDLKGFHLNPTKQKQAVLPKRKNLLFSPKTFLSKATESLEENAGDDTSLTPEDDGISPAVDDGISPAVDDGISPVYHVLKLTIFIKAGNDSIMQTDRDQEKLFDLLYTVAEVFNSSMYSKPYTSIVRPNVNDSTKDYAYNRTGEIILQLSEIPASLQTEINCSQGYIQLQHSFAVKCVACPVGTYYFEESCRPCPVGSYQDEEGRKDCKPCPDGTQTKNGGSANLSECKEICRPGHYSATGVEPCTPCSNGTFQSLPGKHQCRECPHGFTTQFWGASSAEHCKELCPPGSFNSDHGLRPCTLCQLGTYQPLNGSRSCQLCPDKTTTLKEGSSRAQECQALNFCQSEPCLNGGVCNNHGTAFSCSCPRSFYGNTCEHHINPCRLQPCLNNATCSTTSSGFKCHCDQKFTGKLCEAYVNPCDSLPCQHGGSCHVVELDQYVCVCPWQQVGDHCERSNLCAAYPCGSHGKCKLTKNEYKCQCDDGFLGNNCSVSDPCESMPCLNSGICVTMDTGFMCNCPDGFNGGLCEAKTSPCQGHHCENGGHCLDNKGSPFCKCLGGYSGSHCQTVVSANFDLLFRKGSSRDFSHSYSFSKMSDITVSLWTRLLGSTQNSAIFSLVWESEGQIINSLQTWDCSNVKLTLNEKTQETGFHMRQGNWHHILLTLGKNGHWRFYVNGTVQGQDYISNFVVDSDSVYRTFLVLGQKIIPGTLTFDPRYSLLGEITQLNVFDSVFSSSDILLLANQNKCNSSYGNIFAWTDVIGHTHGDVIVRNGSFCLDINECYYSACGYNRQCFDLFEGHQCSSKCISGYQGEQCDQVINECDLDPCHNGATCTDGLLSDDYTCLCNLGYIGRHCEIYTNICPPSLTNVKDFTLGDHNCSCSEITNISQSQKLNKFLCSDLNCLNSNSKSNDTMCDCVKENINLLCSQPEIGCQNNTCFNGGTCVDVDFSKATEGYTCQCQGHWRGTHCDVYLTQVCDANPCLHGGTCLASSTDEDEYVCVCGNNTGGLLMMGPNCEVNPCAADPCGIDSLCVHEDDVTYSCLCGETLQKGPGCGKSNLSDDRGSSTVGIIIASTAANELTTSQRINKDCSMLSCGNGGSCEMIQGMPHCACLKDFNGPLCENYRERKIIEYQASLLIQIPYIKVTEDELNFKLTFIQELKKIYAKFISDGKLDIDVVTLEPELFSKSTKVTYTLTYTDYKDGRQQPKSVLDLQKVLQDNLRTGVLGTLPVNDTAEFIVMENQSDDEGSRSDVPQGKVVWPYITGGMIILLPFLMVAGFLLYRFRWWPCQKSPGYLSSLNNTRSNDNLIYNSAFNDDSMQDKSSAMYAELGDISFHTSPKSSLYSAPPSSDMSQESCRLRENSKNESDHDTRIVMNYKCSQDQKDEKENPWHTENCGAETSAFSVVKNSHLRKDLGSCSYKETMGRLNAANISPENVLNKNRSLTYLNSCLDDTSLNDWTASNEYVNKCGGSVLSSPSSPKDWQDQRSLTSQSLLYSEIRCSDHIYEETVDVIDIPMIRNSIDTTSSSLGGTLDTVTPSIYATPAIYLSPVSTPKFFELAAAREQEKFSFSLEDIHVYTNVADNMKMQHSVHNRPDCSAASKKDNSTQTEFKFLFEEIFLDKFVHWQKEHSLENVDLKTFLGMDKTNVQNCGDSFATLCKNRDDQYEITNKILHEEERGHFSSNKDSCNSVNKEMKVNHKQQCAKVNDEEYGYVEPSYPPLPPRPKSSKLHRKESASQTDYQILKHSLPKNHSKDKTESFIENTRKRRSWSCNTNEACKTTEEPCARRMSAEDYQEIQGYNGLSSSEISHNSGVSTIPRMTSRNKKLCKRKLPPVP